MTEASRYPAFTWAWDRAHATCPRVEMVTKRGERVLLCRDTGDAVVIDRVVWQKEPRA